MSDAALSVAHCTFGAGERPRTSGAPADAGQSANRPKRGAMALSAMWARPCCGVSPSTWSRCVRISMTARYGGQVPMSSTATIVFAPTWLVPDRIPDQPGAGSHRIATDCITGRTVSGRLGPDSDLWSASGGWGYRAHHQQNNRRRSCASPF
jgi:hypothetical protein